MTGPLRVKSDGNGGYIITKGLVWFIGIVFPIITGLAGFGLSQVTDLAVMQERLTVVEQDLEKLESWGPSTGDRYTAENARSDWRTHEASHSAQFQAIMDRLARLEVLVSRDAP